MPKLGVALLCAWVFAGQPCDAGMDPAAAVPAAEEVRLFVPSRSQVFVPRFQRGFVLWMHPKTPAGPDITIQNIRGGDPLELTVEVPETRRTYAQSVSPLPDGQGFVVAAAENLNGTRSSWLLRYWPRGELLNQKRITPFHVGELTVADDVTIWAFGLHSKAQDRDSAEPTLYQFGADGEILQRLAPRNWFEGDQPPCNGAYPGYGKCEIQAAKRHVVAYAPAQEMVLEWDRKEGTPATYKVARPAGRTGQPAIVDAVAVTDSGEILASAGGSLHSLDRKKRQWIPIEETKLPARTWRLFGTSGDLLLVNGDSSDQFHFRLVPWTRNSE